MKVYPRVVLYLFLVVLLSASGVAWGNVRFQDDIGACLSQPDGSSISLPCEEIMWAGRSGRSFAIKEFGERQPAPEHPRLVVVSTRPLPVSEYWSCDLSGVLSTFPGVAKDGSAIRQRVLIVSPQNVVIYCDQRGRPFLFPPLKGLGIDWPNKRSLAELSRTSTAQAASVSIMSEGDFPPMPDLEDSDPAPPAAGSRDSLKWLPDYASVNISNAMVSAVFNGWFYIEKSDRSFGIWISSPDYVYEGQLVDITGRMGTGGEERCVVAQTGDVTIADETNTYPVPPSVSMPNKALGGGAVGLYTPAVADAVGLSNTGLLVRAWGNVTATSYDYNYYCSVFYIDDGSNVVADLQDPNDPNSDYYTGVKVYDPTWDPLPDVGSYQVVNGISSAEIPQGLTSSIRTLWKVNPVTPSTQTGTGTIAGTVTASGANGTVVHVYCGSTSTTTALSSGSASYSLSVPTGTYAVTASVIGNKTLTRLVTVSNGQTATQNFTLTSIAKTIDVVSDSTVLPHDGTSTVEVRIIVRDMEGRRYPNEPVSVSIDKGTIVSAVPTTTDAVGEASFTVQSSTSAETGLIRVTSGSVVSHYLLFYSNPDEPIIWPQVIYDNDTVSGEIELKLYSIDQDAAVPPGGSASSVFEANMYNLRGYYVEIDGQAHDAGIPESEGDTASDTLSPYPMVAATIRTNEFSNGAHAVRFKIEDSAGNSFYSAPYLLVFDNDISNMSMEGNDPTLPEEVDVFNNGNLTISATLKASTDWRVVAYDLNLDDPSGNPYPVELEIATGTGTTVSCTWDGKLYPQQGTNQPDLAYIEIQSNPGGAPKPGDGIGKWIGVKVVSDNTVQVLCFAGRPTKRDITKDAMYVWPVRTYTLYRRAKERGWAAKRLSPTQATWQRVRSIMGNGSCRLVHGFVHSNYQSWNIPGGGTADMTYLWLRGGFVTSGPVNYPVAGSFSELGLQYTNQLLAVFFDGCFTGRSGGYIANPASTAPQVANNARNDMAQVLGMYYGYGYVPKVYMGWHGYGRGGWDWTDFVSSVNSPYGIFGIWCANTGTIMSYVVGHYPTGTATPRITKQPNAPTYWSRIQQNLRCFGTGLMGDNDGYKERTFTVIP